MAQHLTEDHLDRLLAATAAPLRSEAQAAARELATLSRSAADVSQRRPRRGRLLFSVVVGAVLLGGAGTVTAYELSIPPFQGLPEGTARIRPPIIADYDGVDGQRHRCEVFPEFIHLTPEQDEAARAWARRQAWTGYGDRLAAEFTATTAAGEEEQLVDAVSHDLRARIAEQMVPGVALDPRKAEDSGRAGLAGSASSCRVVPDAD